MVDTEDEGGPEAPRRWVEDFFASESEVRSVLAETREQQLLGEHEAVRERLRAFADEESGLFRLIAVTVFDHEQFYADLEAQFGDDETAPTERLRSFGAEYQQLERPLRAVFAEETNELQNPMPGLRRGFRYSEALNLPRLDYEVYSGDVELCRFVHPPSQAIALAENIVASTCDLLDRVEANDDEIANSEREQLARIFESLEAELERLEGHVDSEVESSDEDDDESPHGVSGGHDWSFY